MIKNSDNDGFKREWPNVTVMNDATIKLVDKKWESYGLGSILASPSLKYKTLNIGDGAVRGGN